MLLGVFFVGVECVVLLLLGFFLGGYAFMVGFFVGVGFVLLLFFCCFFVSLFVYLVCCCFVLFFVVFFGGL